MQIARYNISRAEGLLILVIGVAFALRFYRLGFQSFWLDELHTAIEADPSLSWRQLFAYLRCCDQHPPVFFVVEKFVFWLFGSNEWVARAVPALAGTFGVWVMYLLGKELQSPRLGLVAASLTCVNYFHVYYSQEARPYAFLALFGSLSFLYLVRLIRQPGRRTAVAYCVWTLLMLGSHYFGLFAGMAQAVIGVLFVIWEQEARKKLLKYLLVCAVVVAVCFSPWLSFLSTMAAIKSFWIEPVSPGFATDFFYEYFGNSTLLKPFILLFLILALIELLNRKNVQIGALKQDAVSFTFIVCFLWIAVSFAVPYVRSVLVVPMLYPRYTIVVLPAFLIILGMGIASTQPKIGYTLLAFFCLLSLFELFVLKGHYAKPHKTQFRELARYLASDSSASFPVLSQVTGWHQQYYLKKYKFRGAVYRGSMELMIDSALRGQGRYAAIPGFWVSDGHLGKRPSAALSRRIDSTFVILKETEVEGAWARLYVSRRATGASALTLDHSKLAPRGAYELDGQWVAALWDGQAISIPIQVHNGSYLINILSKGTPMDGIFPHLNLLINGQTLGSYEAGSQFTLQSYSYKVSSDTSILLNIFMDNDAHNAAANEDRNAFIKSITFLRIGD